MAAAMQVAESWLLFQKGRTRDALKLLAEADAVLSTTDDYITRGNIQSSYGRMYRREGRYDLGIRHFGNAIEEYTEARSRASQSRAHPGQHGLCGTPDALCSTASGSMPMRPSAAAASPICGATTRALRGQRAGSSGPRGRDLSNPLQSPRRRHRLRQSRPSASGQRRSAAGRRRSARGLHASAKRRRITS